ncbi:hypothetical protein LTS18_002273, partial [Coniosporium uncinatum]
MSGVGANPDVLASYIQQLRTTVANTAASGKPVGHVDTWTAWVNGSNNAVIDACDFIGMDAYPYFQTTIANSIEVSNATFYDAYDATVGAVNGKPVWVTETGWPVSGPTLNQAVASVANAKTYWDQTGCSLFGNINTWWYTLQDAAPDVPSPSFGIVGSTLSTTPLFDLTCPAGTSGDVPVSASRSIASSSVASATAASSVPASAAGNQGSTVTPVPGPGLDTASAGQASSAAQPPANSPAAPVGSATPIQQISDGQIQASGSAAASAPAGNNGAAPATSNNAGAAPAASSNA